MPTDELNQKADEWRGRIQALSESVWEGKAREQAIRDWLEGFEGGILDASMEKLYALYLLHQFIYFGEAEINALLNSLFRDHILYPLVQDCLDENPSISDQDIKGKLLEKVTQMRIIPVGEVSESAAMLAYRLRQTAGLPPSSIQSMAEVRAQIQAGVTIKHVLLTDDFLGTGDQLCDRHKTDVKLLKKSGIRVEYVALIALQRGLNSVVGGGLFDSVRAVIAIDDSYSLAGKNSMVLEELAQHLPLSAADCISLIRHYGNKLFPGHPLGYRNCGVMIGFHHNTPDNALPIFWVRSKPHRWTPIFERHEKKNHFVV